MVFLLGLQRAFQSHEAVWVWMGLVLILFVYLNTKFLAFCSVYTQSKKIYLFKSQFSLVGSLNSEAVNAIKIPLRNFLASVCVSRMWDPASWTQVFKFVNLNGFLVCCVWLIIILPQHLSWWVQVALGQEHLYVKQVNWRTE